MNKDRQNILAILDSIEKILKFTKPFHNADDFYNSQVHFDAAMMNFVIIGEMVGRLSDEFIEQNNHIDWYKIKGFRNLVAHDYFGIDAEEVWQIKTTHLIKLKKDLKSLLDNLDNY